jgi:hypothetical protein
MKDKLREQAQENCILEIVAGSHLYGTSTPESDKDYVGIFMPPEEYIYGLKSVQEIDFSITDKNDEGKNTKDAVDKKLYEFRKFINLALGSNPNILEILYVPEDKIIKGTAQGYGLLEMRDHFLSKICVPKFLGYSKAQKHKMIIRRDHFNELRNGYGFLEILDPKLTMGQVYDRMISASPECKTFWKKETGHHIHCGDICFEPGIYAKKAMKMLKERLDKATNRSELVLKHGYDTKFASHLIRLLRECITILEEQTLIFPLPNSKEILSIKSGEWEIQQVLDLASELENECEELAKTSSLRAKPNYSLIEEFTIRSIKDWLSTTVH